MTTPLSIASRVQSNLVIVVGWGDGSVPLGIAQNRAKEVIALCMPGEDVPPGRAPFKHVAKLETETDVRRFTLAHFASHPDIPPLGGVVIIDDHPLTAVAEEARKVILPLLRTALGDQPQLYGNDIIDSFMGIYHASLNAPTLLERPALSEIMGCYGETPTISIAAGPSLARHIDELRELQHRCILVACDAVLPGLLRQGIEPHYVTPLERLGANAVFTQNVAGTRCAFAGLPVCHPDTLRPFEGNAIGVAGLDGMYNWFWPPTSARVMTGSSTGVLSVSVAVALSRGPVFLVGHDLAREDDATHWGVADVAKDDFKRMTESAAYGTGYDERMIPGNNGKLVRSIAWWDRFRAEIGLIARAIKRQIYNVSAADGVGAVIDGTLISALPSPDSLPEIIDVPMASRPERLREWRGRAAALPDDARSLLREMNSLRTDIGAMKHAPMHTWDIDAMCARMSLHAGISEGNWPVFGYVLRSALHNALAFDHAQLFRTTGPNRARWLTVEGIDALAGGISSAISALLPTFGRIAAV